MIKEKLSTIIEILSFFLITIDLYGSRRLENIQVLLKSVLEKLPKERKLLSLVQTEKGEKNIDEKKEPEGIGAFGIFLALMIYINFNLPFWLFKKEVGAIHQFLYSKINFVAFFLDFLLLALFFVTISFVQIFLINFIINLPRYAINTIDRIIAFVVNHLLRQLEKRKLKGVMIIIGAILFLISKMIVLI